MNTTELYDLFRVSNKDTQVPYLWSDEEVYQYMNDAQVMFCRLTGGIADATSPATEVQAVAGEPFADVDPKILKLRHATRAYDGYQLQILNFEDLEHRRFVNDYNNWMGYRYDDVPGPIRALIVGMELNKVKWVDIPQESQLIRLIIYRMPLKTITGPGEAFEIDEQHHFHLLKWMGYLAYDKKDAETYEKGTSEEFRLAFYSYCAQAKEERERREHKYRTVRYGGI